jgi:hypothetical protein
VAGHQEEAAALEPARGEELVVRQCVVLVGAVEEVVLKHVDDQVLDHHDVARVDALVGPLALVLGVVRVDPVGQVIDHRPVLLLRHPPVVRAHAALDVDDRDVELAGGDAAHDGVRVTEEDRDVRALLVEHARQLRDDRPDHLCVGVAGGAELDVGRRQVELADEHVLEVVGVVLARPDEREPDVVASAQQVDHARRADQVGPDAEDEGDVAHGFR